MQLQKRPEADAASTFHPLHPGLMLNGAVFLSELSGPSATPRGEMTAPSSPKLQGGTQRGGRTHLVLPSRRLRLSGAELGEHSALAGCGCGRGSLGGVPPPSFCRPDRSAPGEGHAGGTTDRWARRSIRRTGALPRGRALPAQPPFHARRGIRAPEARCRRGLVLWAQWALTLASTAGFDPYAVHQCVPGDTVAPPGPVHLLKENRGGRRAPRHRGPHLTLLPGAWDISARAGNLWLEATSTGLGPVPQRWAGTVPPNADRDGQGLGSYPPQQKAPPTLHGRPQLCLQQGA